MRRQWLRLVACVCLGAFLAPQGPAAAAAIARLAVGADADEDHGSCPCGHHCPDCPQGPFAPKCPYPGGCPLCNVAKVPCLAPAACFACSDFFLGSSVVNPTCPYTPPSAGRLIRPPRA